MLETIRQLAAEKLQAEDDVAALRRLHAEYCLALARSANLDAEALGPQRHDLVLPERDDMRAALGWAVETDERELGLELLVALENYWATNAPGEGVEWATALLEGASGIPERLIVRGLRVNGGMENQLGHPDRAEELWERALAIARDLGDEQAVAVLLHRLSHVAMARRDFPLMRQLAEESLAGHRAVGFPKGAAQALSSLAVVARAEGELEKALELLHEARRITDAIGFRWWLAGVLANIGAVSIQRGSSPTPTASSRRGAPSGAVSRSTTRWSSR
jgi:predicted ATPase